MDGCENQELLELLEKFEQEIQIDDIVLVWLNENLSSLCTPNLVQIANCYF